MVGFQDWFQEPFEAALEISDDDLAAALRQNMASQEPGRPQEPSFPPPWHSVKQEKKDEDENEEVEVEYSEEEWAEWWRLQGYSGVQVKDDVEPGDGMQHPFEQGEPPAVEHKKDVTNYPPWALRAGDLAGREHGQRGNANRRDSWGGWYDDQGAYHDPNGKKWEYLVDVHVG